MSQPTTNTTDSCEPCGLRMFERNRYFDGKLLTTRDMQNEQSYLRGKDRLHSSYLHGWGSVCGLKIAEHKAPACRHQFVVLNPGLALDCCGNEIVVREPLIVDLQAEIEHALRAEQRFANGNPDPANVYIRLAYQECATELVPALLDDGACNDFNTEYNRIRETYRLFVDLQEPAGAAQDPLEARLEWQHTLTVAVPQAIDVDRNLNRLYVSEWDGQEGALRMYDTSNHSQVTRVLVSDSLPTALTTSRLGDLIYVADQGGVDSVRRLLIFDQNLLETDPGNAQLPLIQVPGTADVVRLDVSVRDDSLFALLDDGRILRWSSEAIRAWIDGTGLEPEPTTQNLSDATGGAAVQPVDMTQDPNGRWLVVADGSAPRLIALNLAQFDPTAPLANRMHAFPLPAGDIPTSIELSFDGGFLYVLCSENQKLYRTEVRDELESLIPTIPDEIQAFSELPLVDSETDPTTHPPRPLALHVSPRDSWVYILRRLFRNDGTPRDRGDVSVISVEELDRHRGAGAIDQEAARTMRRDGASTEGIAQFQHLAFLGQRLYVAGEIPVEDAEPPQGSISILFIDEASCDTFIRKTIDGCPTCDDHHQGVIIASIQDYIWGEAMVEDAASGPNVIDNETYRPMLPSTNTLHQVIDCMLRKGVSEGIPGPRGPIGPDGPRGPGITEADVSSLPPAAAPTVELVPIAGDEEGDQRLVLGLPRGQAGNPGPRGPGITEVVASTLPSNAPATAALQPIPGDPEGDQRLLLGIPRGAPGQVPPTPVFNRVRFANWHHDELLDRNAFLERFNEVGLVIEFEQPVRFVTLNQRSVLIHVFDRRGQDDRLLAECECKIPIQLQGIRVNTRRPFDVRWLIGDTPTDDTFELIETVASDSAEFVSGVRLHPLRQPWRRLLDPDLGDIARLIVTLRGDWILGRDNRALDGNHIWPGVPQGPTNAGVEGRPSGNGTEGGDWISIIHLEQQ